MKKLDLYIIRKFLGTFFFSLVLILCIVVVFDLSEKIEKLLEHDATFKAVVFDYYMNFIPFFANTFASIFTLISVIFFTSKLAYDSEIIAILSTGISFKRLMLPYFGAACIIAAFTFTLGAFIIPNANKKRVKFEQKYLGKKYSNNERYIHRQIKKGTFIYMSSYSVGLNVGYDFSIENFDGDTLKKKLTSSKITWDRESSKWVISNWKLRVIDGEDEIYTSGKKLDTILPMKPSEFSENPKYIKQQLTLPQLKKYEDQLRFRGSSNIAEFQMERYKMIADVYATFLLTIIGMCLASRRVRGGMGFHLGIGLGLGFSYVLFLRFSSVFAIEGNMDPLISVWMPNLIYTVIAFITYKLAPK